jgi:hypothetical protein
MNLSSKKVVYAEFPDFFTANRSLKEFRFYFYSINDDYGKFFIVLSL